MKEIYVKKFDQSLSRVAFGGMVVAKKTQEDANRFVKEAIEAGINYFDIAPTYFDAEDRLGPALAPYRDQVFLACKTEDRSAKGAEKLLKESLKKLQTTYFDLYQLHAVYNLEDVEAIFAKGGAMEVFLEAKEKGMIKHIGFSAHSTEAALALMDRYDFDSIMFPFNFVSLLKNGYGSYVLEKAKEKGMAIIGIKSMALSVRQPGDDEKHPKSWYHPIEDKGLAQAAVKYSLSRGLDIVVPPGDMEHLRWAIAFMEDDISLSQEELAMLRTRADETLPLFPLKQR